MAEDIWTVEYDNHGNGSFHEWFDVGPVRVNIGPDLSHDEAKELAEAICDMLNQRGE